MTYKKIYEQLYMYSFFGLMILMIVFAFLNVTIAYYSLAMAAIETVVYCIWERMNYDPETNS